MKGPWREVTRIEDSVGPRGGAIWHLWLSCGHFVARRKAGNDPRRAFQRFHRRARFAPKRCRCVACGEGRVEEGRTILATDPVVRGRLAAEIVAFLRR